MTNTEKNYKVDERADVIVKKHGSVKKAIVFLEKELEEMEGLWGKYSCDCLGQGITCTILMLRWLKNK